LHSGADEAEGGAKSQTANGRTPKKAPGAGSFFFLFRQGELRMPQLFSNAKIAECATGNVGEGS
jgi:hypothetical protein